MDLYWNSWSINIPSITDYIEVTRIGKIVKIESGKFLLKFQLSFKQETEEMPLTINIEFELTNLITDPPYEIAID